MICAIHQPNFFPWLGYFNKINESDIFVFLDSVSYPKSSKTMSCYVNRVGIKIQDEKKWVNCPVVRTKGEQKICDVEIFNERRWKDKLLKTLQLNYSKSNFYYEVMADIETLIWYESNSISEFNKNAIIQICDKVGISTRFISQSDICTKAHSTELLVEILKSVGGDAYLCGKGAKNYQDDTLFEKNGIKLIHQNYSHPTYYQGDGEFIPGLSVMDALFWLGYDGTKKILDGRISADKIINKV